MQSTQADSVEARMSALTHGLPTKSAKIRALGGAGYSRSQIADFLGLRYQHVRNVLVDAGRVSGRPAGADQKEGAPVATGKPVHRAQRVEIGPDGSVMIPAEVLAAAGTAPGNFLLLRVHDDEIKLVTPEAATRKIQAAVRKVVPEGVSLVEELFKERRREVTREQGDA